MTDGEPGVGARTGAGTLWQCLAGSTAVVGCLCGLATWGLRTTATVAFSSAVIGCCLSAMLSAASGMQTVRRTVRAGLVVGLAATATLGLVGVLGVTGLVAVLVVAGTHPASRRALRVHAKGLGSGPAVQSTRRSGRPESAIATNRTRDIRQRRAVELDNLSDAELCMTWRRSFVWLEAACVAPERVLVVQLRQELLDELQRRHPAGVSAWLASGARAAGNPLPFLERRPDPRRRDAA